MISASVGAVTAVKSGICSAACAPAACKESGVGTSFIPDIKRGRVPSVDKFEKLANYLGTTVSDLIGEKKEPTVQDDGLSEAEQALMDQFRQLTPEQQDMVIRMVQAAADKQ